MSMFRINVNLPQLLCIVAKPTKSLKFAILSGRHDNTPQLCMKSRADCQFPISWKKSQVTAVFKKGNRLDVNNYRPISLLSVPSKILERAVCRSFDNHLTSHNLLSDRQWGFRKGHSTESLSLHVTEVWKEALDDGLKV